ncbi:unnamed protein product [Closterium sp. NIES-54]
MGSSGAAGRTRVTIRLEQPIPRGLYADPFELERILRPAGDRAWVVDPVELEQPAPRCEETVAVMGRDVALGEGEQKGEGKGEGEGAGGKVRKGEGAGDEEGRGEGEGDMRVGEDEVAFSLESIPFICISSSETPFCCLSHPLTIFDTTVHVPLPSACLVLPPPLICSGPSALHPSTPSSPAPALASPSAAAASESPTISAAEASPSAACDAISTPRCECLPMQLAWPSQAAAAEEETDGVRLGAAGLGGDSEGDEAAAAAAEGRHEEGGKGENDVGEKGKGERGKEEGALLWEVPAGCAAHMPLVLWGTSLAAAVGALVLVAMAAAAPVHTAGTKAK